MPTYEERYARLIELEKKRAEIEKKHAEPLKKANNKIIRAGQLPPEVRSYFLELRPVMEKIAEVRGKDPDFLEYYKKRRKEELRRMIDEIKKAGTV